MSKDSCHLDSPFLLPSLLPSLLPFLLPSLLPSLLLHHAEHTHVVQVWRVSSMQEQHQPQQWLPHLMGWPTKETQCPELHMQPSKRPDPPRPIRKVCNRTTKQQQQNNSKTTTRDDSKSKSAVVIAGSRCCCCRSSLLHLHTATSNSNSNSNSSSSKKFRFPRNRCGLPWHADASPSTCHGKCPTEASKQTGRQGKRKCRFGCGSAVVPHDEKN